MSSEMQKLIAKYDVPAPRYTSYPTVPYWEKNPSTGEWIDNIQKSLQPDNASIAIYIHIPFCESLCTFCGCNTSITKNHSVEDPYIDSLLQEFNMYIERAPELKTRKVKELHLGGGSPTYLSEDNMKRLIEGLTSKLNIDEDYVFSIEVDPRRTRKTQLETLYKLGFRRISLGVQDFDEEVQKLINRFQPFEKTKFVTEESRALGYNSVNFDLIYGLPRQNEATMRYTIEKTLELLPDRIAFYSYAHVPWIKAAHRLFTEEDLPRGPEKRKLYEIGLELFSKNQYMEIGMDHFSLKEDKLYRALQTSSLHRNFMGYTDNKTDLLFALGVSAIADSWTCFHQNEKILKKYQKKLSEGQFPSLRGH
ncbi:MAG: oxygen-independent coproporphyrinogen III oxidase, partial [Leptospiraceae bacterium]|nr:oxygen-independent coproporphyrinogen III oxidase [Leptospiraceae bacterium]